MLIKYLKFGFEIMVYQINFSLKGSNLKSNNCKKIMIYRWFTRKINYTEAIFFYNNDLLSAWTSKHFISPMILSFKLGSSPQHQK